MLVVQKMTEGFGPKVQGFDHFKFGDHKRLNKMITKTAIMIELIISEEELK